MPRSWPQRVQSVEPQPAMLPKKQHRCAPLLACHRYCQWCPRAIRLHLLRRHPTHPPTLAQAAAHLAHCFVERHFVVLVLAPPWLARGAIVEGREGPPPFQRLIRVTKPPIEGH